MTDLNYAEFAFPVPETNYCGMTLRDYFAAAALTGILARRDGEHPDDPAATAYQYADDMLDARRAEQGG